jgi:hypothetical protein
MLPGFRFLFAAIMLSMSLLVFGLGAAALLRAAHESFASNSSWRAAPEATFAQRSDSTLPMLATLRVDPPVVEKTPEQALPAASPVETSPLTPAPAIAEQVAVLKPIDAAPAETTMTSEGAPPAMPPAENPPPATTPPAREATAKTGDRTAIAAITPPSGAGESAAAPPEPPSASQAAPDQTGIATAKIATLGGPPVDVTEDTVTDTPPARDRAAKPDQARDDQSTIKRRVQAKRVVHRRRLAARARLAIQAQQQQANPFAVPTPAVTAPRR